MGNHCCTAQQINENELDLRNGNKEGKEKSKSKSLTNAECHEYVRNLHYNKNKLNFSVKGGTQKSTTKKIKFDQNTNDSLYLCGGEFLCCGCYIKRRQNETTDQKDNEIENEEENKKENEEKNEEENEKENNEENENSKNCCNNIVSIEGISNTRNTSYLNACLQCLLASKPLNDYFKDSEWEKDINSNSITEGKVAQIYSKFVNTSSSKEFENEDLDDFKNQVCKFMQQFERYGQQDSHELLSAIIEALSQDLNKADSSETFNAINTQGK